MFYLAQRFEVCFHDEVIFAQLTAACIRALDPLVQTSMMHKTQTSCTVAGSDEGTFFITFTVTDSAKTHANKIRQSLCAFDLSFISPSLSPAHL